MLSGENPLNMKKLPSPRNVLASASARPSGRSCKPGPIPWPAAAASAAHCAITNTPDPSPADRHPGLWRSGGGSAISPPKPRNVPESSTASAKSMSKPRFAMHRFWLSTSTCTPARGGRLEDADRVLRCEGRWPAAGRSSSFIVVASRRGTDIGQLVVPSARCGASMSISVPEYSPFVRTQGR